VQRNVSTILIAFAAGILVAGGGAYLMTDHHHQANEQQLQQQAIAKLKRDALPAADATPATDPAAAAAPADTADAAPAERAAKPADERTSAVRRRPAKPSPARATADNAAPDRHTARTESKPQLSDSATVAQNNVPASAPATQVQTPAPTSAAQATQTAASQPLNPPAETQTAVPPPPAPKTITLAPGTPVSIRLNETLSSDRNSEGDTFTASLDKPIVVEGFVIADRGARVLGKVIKSERAGRVKGVSNLELALTQVHTTDDQTVTIDTTPLLRRGDTSKERDAAKVAGGAALGAIIGAIAGGGKGAAIGAGTGGAAGGGVVLSQRGKQTTLPAETRLTFTLQNPVTITERLN